MLLRWLFAEVRPPLIWLALLSVAVRALLIVTTFGLTALVPLGVPWTWVRTLRMVPRLLFTLTSVPDVEIREVAIAEPVAAVWTSEFATSTSLLDVSTTESD